MMLANRYAEDETPETTLFYFLTNEYLKSLIGGVAQDQDFWSGLLDEYRQIELGEAGEAQNSPGVETPGWTKTERK